MALSDTLDQLREFDFNDLDFERSDGCAGSEQQHKAEDAAGEVSDGQVH